MENEIEIKKPNKNVTTEIINPISKEGILINGTKKFIVKNKIKIGKTQ